MHNWCVYSQFEDASKAAADFLASRIEQCIKDNDICHVVLPGGNTPATCLEFLAAKPVDWQKVHWYLGDERCVPQGHRDRNDVMLEKHLWSKLESANVHRIPAELGAEAGAEAYCREVSGFNFDIVFLGMGEDGHTASLFPGNPALQDKRPVVPVHHSPKAPADRVSLSVDTLQKASCRLVLTSGSAKADVIKRIKDNEGLPINMLGDIFWYVDNAAVSQLSDVDES